MFTFLSRLQRELFEFNFSFTLTNDMSSAYFVDDGKTEQDNPPSPFSHWRFIRRASTSLVNRFNTQNTSYSLAANHRNGYMNIQNVIQFSLD